MNLETLGMSAGWKWIKSCGFEVTSRINGNKVFFLLLAIAKVRRIAIKVLMVIIGVLRLTTAKINTPAFWALRVITPVLVLLTATVVAVYAL